jgi:hypothetical protein
LYCRESHPTRLHPGAVVLANPADPLITNSRIERDMPGKRADEPQACLDSALVASVM